MSKLTARQRNKLKPSQFALPGGKYPVNDKSHARNALSRASQQFNSGRLSASQKAKVIAAAHQELARK